MFDRNLSAALPNKLLQHEESLRRTFPPLTLYKGISDFPCFLILMIYTKTTRWNLALTLRPHSLSNTRNENHKVLEQPWRDFTSLKLCQCSQIPQPSSRVTSTSNRIKTITIGLIIYKHFTRIRLHHLTLSLAEWLRGSSRTRWETQNLALASFPHSLDLTPETKRWNLRSAQRSYFIQLHQERREKLIPSNTR